jgi:hypothetical protein
MTLFDDDPHLLRAMEAMCDVHGWETIERIVRLLGPSPEVPSAPARWTDPETSHSAGPRVQDVGRFSTKSRQAKLLQQFAMHPLTDQQATVSIVGSHAAPSAFDGCRRRCSDLRAAHFLTDSGKRRKNAGSDDDSIVWEITLNGQHALELLDRTGWSR